MDLLEGHTLESLIYIGLWQTPIFTLIPGESSIHVRDPAIISILKPRNKNLLTALCIIGQPQHLSRKNRRKKILHPFPVHDSAGVPLKRIVTSLAKSRERTGPRTPPPQPSTLIRINTASDPTRASGRRKNEQSASHRPRQRIDPI